MIVKIDCVTNKRMQRRFWILLRYIYFHRFNTKSHTANLINLRY